MSTSQTVRSQCSDRTSDLWADALKLLSVEDRSIIGVQNPNKAAVLQKLLAVTTEKKELCLKKRWKYRGKNGDVVLRDQLEKVTAWLVKFKDTGNAIAQYDPSHVALPWAGVLFLLQITINDSQIFGEMIDGVELVAHTLARYTILEQLYLTQGQPSAMHDQVTDNFVKLYVSILRYLAKAKTYFAKPTLRRILKSSVQPPEAAVHVHLDLIRKKARGVDASLEVLKSQCLEATHGKTSQLLQLLSDLERPILRSATQISQIHDHLKINERAQIIRWLSTVPVSLHHKTVGKTFLPGSCDWFLRLPAFVDFEKSSVSTVLWLHGIPGSGKTFLTHRVIKHLLQGNNRNLTTAPVAYFYCARNPAERQRSSPDEIMRSLLRQLGCSSPDKPVKAPVVSLFTERLNEAEMDASDPIPPTAAECVPIILKLLEKDPATIVIDAIDECDPAQTHELLSALELILQESANLVKIFVSSRDAGDISDAFSGGPNIYLRAEHNADDLERFIHQSLEDALHTRRLLRGSISETLKSEIICTLREGAGGMFRWVTLQIANLCDGQRVKIEEDVRREVGRLPKTLATSYDVLYQRISNLAPGSRDVAEHVIKWLLCAQTLLDADTLTSIIQLTVGSGSISISHILDICSYLVVLDDRNNVRFAHLSVREWFEGLSTYSPEECHSAVLQTCIASYPPEHDHRFWISTADMAAIRPYAMVYWPLHCSRSKLACGSALRNTVEQFVFDGPRPTMSFEDWVSDAWNASEYTTINGDGTLSDKLGASASPSSTPLFLACCFDMVWILDSLLSHGFTDWNLKNNLSEPAIKLAAQYGAYPALVWLLEKGNFSEDDIADALTAALEVDDRMSADALLAHGVNGFLQIKDTEETFLEFFVEQKDIRILNCLLQESSPFEPIGFGKALRFAFRNQSSDAFATMWSKCTELDPSLYLAVLLSSNVRDHTSLEAYMLDHARKTVKLSDIADLDRLGAIAALRNIGTGSDISVMFSWRRIDWSVIKDIFSRYHANRLLDFHSRPGEGCDYLPPLIVSACLRNKSLAMSLIPFCDTNDELKGWTALGMATTLNHPVNCEILLANGADPEQVTMWGTPDYAKPLSPLELAVMYNRLAVAKILCIYGADVRGYSGTTALHHAARMGFVKMLALLCAQGADINAADAQGKTAIHYAVKSNQHKSLRYLCRKADANVNAKSNKGKTPLMVAVRHGCLTCLTLLLTSGGDIKAVDNDGKDVFAYIRYKGSPCSITKKLLRHGAKWNTQSSETPFAYPLLEAVNAENLALTQRFLEAGMDPNGQTWNGKCPLGAAILRANPGMVKLLLRYGADPSLKVSGTTPLHLAILESDVEIVRILISRATSVDARDCDGHTPLHLVVMHNCPIDLIDLLLTAGAAETCRNLAGLTPLEVSLQRPRDELPKPWEVSFRRRPQDQLQIHGPGDDNVALVSREYQLPGDAIIEIEADDTDDSREKIPADDKVDAITKPKIFDPTIDYYNSYGVASWTPTDSRVEKHLRPLLASYNASDFR